VNIAGIGIILQMRERMEEMNRQMQNFVEYVRNEMLARFQSASPGSAGAIVPIRKTPEIRPVAPSRAVNPRKP
jgi:MerR family transcriptional regulator/heat shock protein HspR